MDTTQRMIAYLESTIVDLRLDLQRASVRLEAHETMLAKLRNFQGQAKAGKAPPNTQ